MKFRLAAAVFLGCTLGWAEPEPATANRSVLLGADVLRKSDFEPLRGKQIGLITNQTGVDSRGVSTIDLLARASGVKLVALFSPEHGIRGEQEHGESVGDSVDARTNLPVYSLYGETRKPTPMMLNAIDALVFDMQDVGTRFYTYITTLGLAMEAAADRGIELYVLDRPNPIGGARVEGERLDASIRHFTAYYSIPVRHGLTVGELARWYNERLRQKADLKVIAMQGWSRDMLWPETGLSFVPPSPNIRRPAQAILYAGIGAFEATNVAVGRGTDAPFEQIGAPWLRGMDLAAKLSSAPIAGVTIEPTEFTPASDLYRGQLCSGIRLRLSDADRAPTTELFPIIAFAIRDLQPREFVLRWEEIPRVTGTRRFEQFYRAGKPVAAYLEAMRKSAATFESERAPFLLYP